MFLQLTLIIYLEHVLPSNLAQHTSSLFNISRGMCPYSDLCSTRVADEPTRNTETPCCFPCYCDDACWNFHDCCPDVESTRKSGSHDIRCISGYHVGEYVTRPMVNNTVYMLSDCPDNSTEEEVLKCHGEFDELQDIEDLMVVADSERWTRLYRNKHCAKCNGVMSIKRWPIHVVNCEPTMHVTHLTLSEMKEFLMRNCSIDVIPVLEPSQEYNNMPRCHPEVCPLRDEPTAEQTQCHEIEYRPMYNVLPVVPKNTNCYLCNEIPISGQFCQKYVKDERHVPDSMLELIDIDTSTEPLPEVISDICAGNEAFDRFFRRCRKVRCPQYKSVYHGHCVSIGSLQQSGFYVGLRNIFLPMRRAKVLKPTRVKTDIDSIRHNIHRHYSLGKCIFTHFFLDVFADASTDYLAFLRSLYILNMSPKCTIRHITSHLIDIDSRKFLQEIDFYFEKTVFLVKMHFYKFNVSELKTTDDGLFKTVYHKRIGQYKVPLPKVEIEMFNCPYYILNICDYNDVIHKVAPKHRALLTSSTLNQSSELAEGFYPLSKDEIGICIETFDKFVSSDTVQCISSVLNFLYVCMLINTIRTY